MALAALATATACTSSGSPAHTTPSATSHAPTVPVVKDCPAVHGSGFSAIDYVDFIQAFGQQYVAGLGSRPTSVSRSDLGRVVLRSSCSFSALNDRTHKNPGEPRDGDTGFLAAGTPIYAIGGWSTQCRLAAESPAGGLVAYLALDGDAKHAKPRACALHH